MKQTLVSVDPSIGIAEKLNAQSLELGISGFGEYIMLCQPYKEWKTWKESVGFLELFYQDSFHAPSDAYTVEFSLVSWELLVSLKFPEL